MDSRHCVTRRQFLNRVALGCAGALALAGRQSLGENAAAAGGAAATSPATKVGLTHGERRAENVYNALKPIEAQVREKLQGKKRIVLKPNMVVNDRPLTSTHADCLEGALEFLRPMFDGEIVVAESSANGPALEGYDNFGYRKLENPYRVKFVDLDAEPFEILHVVDEHWRPRPVRFSKVLLDPEALLVSTPRLKTHDRVVVTLGLKNVAAGGILKDPKYRWGAGSEGHSDKPLIHGGRENQGIHFNLFSMAKTRPPDLTILDGFEAMEHNGPNDGTPVDHRIALAGTDWLAVDRLGAELMGFDCRKIGYLAFAGEAGLGQADRNAVEVLGENPADCVRQYVPHDNIESQYRWLSEDA